MASERLNRLRIYVGSLKPRIYVGFVKDESAENPVVSENIDVTDMVLGTVANLLLQDGKRSYGGVQLDIDGVPGVNSVRIVATLVGGEKVAEPEANSPNLEARYFESLKKVEDHLLAIYDHLCETDMYPTSDTDPIYRVREYLLERGLIKKKEVDTDDE